MKRFPICKKTVQFVAIVVALSACGSPHYEDLTALADVDHAKEFFSRAPESSISNDGKIAIRVDASNNRVEWYQRLTTENKSDGEILPCYYQLAGDVARVSREKVFMGVSEVDHIQFKKPQVKFVWMRGMSEGEMAANKKHCNEAAYAKVVVDGTIFLSAIPILDYSKDFLSVAEPDCLGVRLGGCSSRAELQKKSIHLNAINSSQFPFDRDTGSPLQQPTNP